MNYYIDFDNTMFDTPKLTKAMLTTLVNEIISKHDDKNFDETYTECKGLFNREHFYSIYALAKHFCEKYNLIENEVISKINFVISNTTDFVYPDTIPFLKSLKEAGHKLYILSYCKESLKYQSAKISGSGIADFFDALYITATPKYELDINYSNGIFIDDNPSDLVGLCSKNPIKVIRISRPDNKYSAEKLENLQISEYNSLGDIT